MTQRLVFVGDLKRLLQDDETAGQFIWLRVKRKVQ